MLKHEINKMRRENKNLILLCKISLVALILIGVVSLILYSYAVLIIAIFVFLVGTSIIEIRINNNTDKINQYYRYYCQRLKEGYDDEVYPKEEQ